MKKKVLAIVLTSALVLSLGLVLAGPAGADPGSIVIDFESTGLNPGDSVKGAGTIHPLLNIQGSQAVELVKEGVGGTTSGWGYNTEPGIYNDGLDEYGIADGEFRSYDCTEDYEFQIVGTTVCYFSIEMYDYGDFFPCSTAQNMTHTVKLIAYDSLDNPIAESDPLTFTSSGSGNMYRTSGTDWAYGGTNLHVAGDAYGERDLNDSPGRWKFEVSASGIAKVKVVFDGDQSVDPGIGLDNIEFVESIDVFVDIKPTSCPNPLNVKSKGVLPVAILGTEGFDVTEIDPATVALFWVGSDPFDPIIPPDEISTPLRTALEDVAAPYDGELVDCLSCWEEGPDGFLDLTLKFDKQEIIAAIVGEVEDGDCISLILAGNLYDGTPFSGSDIVRIIKKGR